MKAILCSSALALLAGTACAVDLKSEALVLEIPNAAADALVESGRKGETEAWKAIVSADGAVAEGKPVKLIARFEAKDFADGKANHLIKEEEPGGTTRSSFYQVSAKDSTASRRYVGFQKVAKDPNAMPLKNWRIELTAPMTAEWSFSARHRMKDKSWIVLEKSEMLAGFEKADSKWAAFRMMARAKPVAKKEQKLAKAEFVADPDEFYRVEWRFRDTDDTSLSHEDIGERSEGNAAIGINPAVSRHCFPGEKAHLHRTSKGYTSRLSSERLLEAKGSKVRVLRWEVFRANHEPDLGPVAVRRPAEHKVTEYKGNLGESKGQPSKIESEFIAD